MRQEIRAFQDLEHLNHFSQAVLVLPILEALEQRLRGVNFQDSKMIIVYISKKIIRYLKNYFIDVHYLWYNCINFYTIANLENKVDYIFFKQINNLIMRS